MSGDTEFKLPDVPGGWREDEITTASGVLRIARPAQPDLILDDPATLEENAINDYMPYWCWLWPASIQMASVIHRLPLEVQKPILEVGCGLGLVGIAGLYAGFDMVLSDYRKEALSVATYNAGLNGFPSARVELSDWREPVVEQFAAAIACDVLYETKEHEPILRFVDRLLTDDGQCWIGDPGRTNAVQFLSSAAKQFDVSIYDKQLNRLAEPALNQFYLMQLQR
ncbi:MAG: methyltransferase, partial [Planctomycetaceae bacterium]